MLERLEVDGYRSLRDLAVDLGQVTLVTGPNGSGKTNIYRALQLVRSCAEGDVARRVAAEGGMASVVWAGPLRHEPRVHLAVLLDGLVYEVSLATIGRGRPSPALAFPLDPIVASERIERPGEARRAVTLLERRGATGFVRDQEGRRVPCSGALHESEPLLAELGETWRYPEVAAVRRGLRRMRFHHQLRTDEDSPARQPALGTRTPAVSGDGADLAAALATIEHDGDRKALDRCVSEAFGGARIVLREDLAGRLELQLDTRGPMSRPLRASELSDGQLLFLYLAALLLAPRPAEVAVLNEPESSLHPGLLAGLAELVGIAAEQTQVICTTHAQELVALLAPRRGTVTLELELVDGATRAHRR